MTNTLELGGLAGTNPLGFFAALGVLSLPDEKEHPPTRLAWTDEVVPHPVVFGPASTADIADRAMTELDEWRTATVLNFTAGSSAIADVKLSKTELRQYVQAAVDARDGGRSLALISALVAEGSYDNSGQAKPTDLHFSAGQQKFLQMARDLFEGLERADLSRALTEEWVYPSRLPSFMWDVTDDRVYALRASDPSSEKKQTEPGAEFLALLGLTCLPVFAQPGRTKTTACSGSWKSGTLTWPIWDQPCDLNAARSLIAHASLDNNAWLASWGVTRLLRSAIRRSDQGGYGTFSPPTEVWRVPS